MSDWTLGEIGYEEVARSDDNCEEEFPVDFWIEGPHLQRLPPFSLEDLQKFPAEILNWPCTINDDGYIACLVTEEQHNTVFGILTSK